MFLFFFRRTTSRAGRWRAATTLKTPARTTSRSNGRNSILAVTGEDDGLWDELYKNRSSGKMIPTKRRGLLEVLFS